MHIFIFSWLWLWVAVASGIAQKPPNIVFIMVDDMVTNILFFCPFGLPGKLIPSLALGPRQEAFIVGIAKGWNDVSFHGSDQIQTPNIDSLAYQGVILQQYYSEAICTPARSALLTGKYSMRLGMHGLPLTNAEHRGIPLTERLLPSYLKDLGYATHLVGKWHVGMSMKEFLPTYRGYDTHYGIRGGVIDYYTYNHIEPAPDGQLMFGLDLFDNEIPQDEEQRYIVDALTDRAVKIIIGHNISQPLFLHLAHNAPHVGCGAPLQPPLFNTIKNKHIANSDRRLYAEIVTHMDRSIGELVRALAEKNILEDTVIAFVSDNGAPTVGMSENAGVNLPFRGVKYTPWEGAVRVPALIWHASLKPSVWNGLMHVTDWLPTLVAAARGQVDRSIDGVNQWDSIVQNGDSQRKEVLLTIEDGRLRAYASYRSGDYKIVLGNVTGLPNDYYGAQFMVNKQSPSEYFSTLKSCQVARWFTYMGKALENDKVSATRRAIAVTQEDLVTDLTPCKPSPTKGCLFNVRRDPAEKHDLWKRANKIATLLTSRLQDLWAQQMRRGPRNIGLAADPANFGYIWWPWVEKSELNATSIPVTLT